MAKAHDGVGAVTRDATGTPADARTPRGDAADLVLGLAAGLGLACAAFAIDRELSRPAVTDAPREPIATVTLATGGAKRRSGAGLTWDYAGAGEQLGRGDGLYVPENALVEVEFADGSRLTVEESSLVVIDDTSRGNPQPAVRLRQGGVSAAPGARGLQVVAGGGRASIAPRGTARVSLEADGGARVDVARGAATLAAGTAPELTLPDRASAAITNGQRIRQLDVRANLLEPGHEARRYFGGTSAAVRFTWQTQAANVVLDVADDRTFARMLLSRAASSRSLLVTDLAPGAYFWRVRGTDGAWSSEARALRLLRDIPPEPISPFRGQVVYAPGATTTTFRWSRVAGAPGYRMQIAATADFGAVLLERDVDAPSVHLSAFAPEGTYYWRVRTRDPQRGESPFSRAIPFRLVVEPLPQAPQLYDPEIEVNEAPGPPPAAPRQEQGWWWRLFVGGVARAGEPPPAAEVSIVLRWGAVPGVVAYVLEIAEDASFRRVMVRERLAQPYYRWSKPATGESWWRVQSIDARGRAGEFSAPRNVVATSGIPLLSAPVDGARFATGLPAIALAWEPVALAARYVVEIALDPRFQEGLTTIAAREPRAQFRPKRPGTYYWRVRALDAAGGAGDFAVPRKLHVELDPPVLTPVAERVLRRDEPVTLGAAAVTGATAYDIEVVAAASPTPPVFRARRRAPAVDFIAPSAGVWLWRMRALAGSEASPWSAPEPLRLTPAPVVPTTPADGARLDPPAAVAVIFEPSHGATGYRVEASREESGAIVATILTTEPRCELAGLAAGSYRLSIVALAGELSSAPSPPVRFVRTAPLAVSIPAETAAQPPADPEPPASPPTARARLRAGGSAEVVTNFAASGTPAAALELSRDLTGPVTGLAVAARAAYHQRRLKSAGPPPSSAVQHAVPLGVGLRLTFLHGRVAPYVGAGGLLGILHARIRSAGRPVAARTLVGLGVEAAAGAETPVGPGAAFGEVRWAWLRRRDRVVVADGGGLVAGVGYRMEL